MNYDRWKESPKNPDTLYDDLWKHRKSLLEDVGIHNQQTIAGELSISKPTFSAIINILKAEARNKKQRG